jgi:hypothetical protein
MKIYVSIFVLCSLLSCSVFYYVRHQSTTVESQFTSLSPVGTEEPKLSAGSEKVNQSEILIQEVAIVQEPSEADEVHKNIAPIPASEVAATSSSSTDLQEKAEQNKGRIDLLRQLIEFKTTVAKLEEQGVNTDKIIPKDMSASELVGLLEYRKAPYKNVNGFKPLPLRSGTQDFGMFLVSTSKDVSLHAFDEKGLFSGIIQLGADGVGIPIEEIRGVDLYTFIDRGFMVTGGTGEVTVFIDVLKTGIAQLYTRVGNGDVESYFFPVSSQSKGSTTFKRSDDSIELMHWNIDVDGDGKTDVSFGHAGPNEKQVRLMFDLIKSDTDLSIEEQGLFSEESIDAFIKFLDPKDES